MVGRYIRFIHEWEQYNRLEGAEPLNFEDSYPMLTDRTETTSVDVQYFYQSIWATERIARVRANIHVDVGSAVSYVGMLTIHLPVVFIDIRPPLVKLPNLTSLAGSLLNIPLSSQSVASLSCLHVVEHVGLGRYGDPLLPSGTRLSCAELFRVLMPGGHLFFSTPVGKPRVCFNAHRIHSPQQILAFFDKLELVEFSAVDDRGQLKINIKPAQMETANYACGLFWLKRPN
jgi:hypothetical protein